MIRRLHHVCILTNDIDATVSHYVRMAKVDTPAIRDVDRPDLQLRTTMVASGPGADTFLQLIEPHRGPGVQELADRGEGSIFEIAFEVNNLAEMVESLRRRDIYPVDFVGHRLTQPFATAASGNRYAYLPTSASRGTRTELFEPASGSVEIARSARKR